MIIREAVDVAAAAQLACLLEVSAPKPGNVSPGRPFADLCYEDFLASAAAIGPAFAAAGGQTAVGETVLRAVEATSRWTRSNSNLGIVLLLAPLARAALSSPAPIDLRPLLRNVLDSTTVQDARLVYAAIRRAAPGGLGRVGEQDVASEPTAPLLEVMKLAAAWDGIAREYATGYEVTFEIAVPALELARADSLSWNDAIVETFLTVLAARPDTHVARRAGLDAAADISRRARLSLDAGGVRTVGGRQAIEEMDASLRGERHLRNPGTTADLMAAAIFVVLLTGHAWSSA
jgi:triphosphoribosyl-dephospho-CoA synthase